MNWEEKRGWERKGRKIDGREWKEEECKGLEENGRGRGERKRRRDGRV